MDKQMNEENQTMQQNGQTPDSQIPPVPQKPKVNFWVFSTVFFALLFLVTVVVFAVNYSKQQILQSSIPNNTVQTSPTSTVNNRITEEPTLPPDSTAKLEDFPSRELLGENDNYAVFLINQKTAQTQDNTGELVVYEKKSKRVITITGTFSIFGATTVVDDMKGEYVLLSTGTSVVRNVIPLSLTKKAQAGKEFCSISNFLFYKDYVIYGNCDTFQNRPWEAGQAASLVVLNLISGEKKIIGKSDLLHQYGPTKISDDTLYYTETYVTKEDDWQIPDNQKTISKTFNLLSL